jgi:DNA-binding LytR/AlgR family response regulator
MIERTLRGCRVLVVEDEYMLADELRTELQEAGAVVVGPAGQLEAAIDLIQADADIGGAVLDVNLGGVSVFPVVDLLAARGVPMVLTTGYDAAAIPPRYAHIPRCEKPVTISKVAKAIGGVIHT